MLVTLPKVLVSTEQWVGQGWKIGISQPAPLVGKALAAVLWMRRVLRPSASSAGKNIMSDWWCHESHEWLMDDVTKVLMSLTWAIYDIMNIMSDWWMMSWTSWVINMSNVMTNWWMMSWGSWVMIWIMSEWLTSGTSWVIDVTNIMSDRLMMLS